MKATRRDYSIFEKFNFEYKPVGVKFLLNKPDKIKPIGSNMPICRMFKEAQDGPPFYAGKDNFACVDRLVLGLEEPNPITESGQIGAKERIYQEARANARIYHHIQKIPKDTVRYVVFSTLDRLSFNPDILILTATPSQAEIILRGLSYSTGKPIISQTDSGNGCDTDSVRRSYLVGLADNRSGYRGSDSTPLLLLVETENSITRV